MTGQVRPVTSWMISAGPDARATGANAYVSAGATRIRAVGACPSRSLPLVPRSRSVSPSAPLLFPRCSTQHRVSIRTSLACYNPHTNEPGLSSRSPVVAALDRSLPRETAGKNDFYSCHRRRGRRKDGGIERGRKIEKEGTARSDARIRKLYRGESNLPSRCLNRRFSCDFNRRCTAHHALMVHRRSQSEKNIRRRENR